LAGIFNHVQRPSQSDQRIIDRFPALQRIGAIRNPPTGRWFFFQGRPHLETSLFEWSKKNTYLKFVV